MRRPRRHAPFLLLIALASLVLSGCALAGPGSGGASSFTLARWTAQIQGSTPREVTLPAHFDDRLPRAPTEYTLTTSAVLPDDMRGRPLTFTVQDMPAMAWLKVDGAVAAPLRPGTLDRYRASNPHVWVVPEEATRDGRVDLELHVLHRMSRSAWIDSVPVLTTHPLGGARNAAVHAFNLVAAIAALTADLFVAFLYGILFLFHRRTKRRIGYGWFTVGAVSGMIYPAFVLGVTQPVFGAYEPLALTILLVLGSLAATHFSRVYGQAPPPSKAWWGLFGICVAVVLWFRSPFVSIWLTGPVIVAFTAAQAIAQVVFLVRLRKVRKYAPTMIGIALAWPAAVACATPDILAWMGRGELAGGVRFACIGVAVLALYQAVELSRTLLVALRRADSLNAQLEERVRAMESKKREVELLNDELRRQIAARSRELAEKLAGMDDGELEEAPALELGTVVEGRYRVLRHLGAGGMGSVYEVERITDDKHFALKALAGGVDSQARARFAREAQLVANVNHPNVVSIVDIDVAEKGYVFLVMELVESGTTLVDVRRRHKDEAWTLRVLAQVADGIHAIHAAGIVHRDLKPGNILLARGADGRKPQVKITDFGISTLQADGTRDAVRDIPSTRERLMSLEYDPDDAVTLQRPEYEDVETKPEGAGPKRRSDAPNAMGAVSPSGAAAHLGPHSRGNPKTPLTQTGVIFGTPQYMAQELTAGTKSATTASDVFSLGIIAFELLTGHRPFPESPINAKLAGRSLPQAPPMSAACPALPPSLATMLDRAISHDPGRRPTAAQLAAALKEAAPITDAP